MKFLYFTDTHIRATNPIGRIDNFSETLLKKFLEIGEIAKEYDVDFFVHGGDILDRPDVPLSAIRPFLKVMIEYKKPIFFVPGNHDIYAYNLSSIGRTPLAIMDDFGLITTLNRNSPVSFTIDDTSVTLHSAPFTPELDTELEREFYVVKQKTADFDIMFAHGMLLTKPFELIRHTLVNDIKHTKAELTLCGHYHTGFKLTDIDDKLFYNPGSVARMSATDVEINRSPKVLIIELNKDKKIQITDVLLKSAKKGSEVLNRDYILESKKEQENRSFFESELLNSGIGKTLDISEILDKLETNEVIDENVRKRAITLVREVEESGEFN